jgi:hypothetical protein
VPGDGDSDLHVKHAVTVSDARTFGHSPGNADAVKAMTIDAAGSITIQSGGTLRARGDVEDLSTQSAPLTVQGGGVWEFDSSAAASPSATNYTFRANGGPSSFLTFSGSANGADSSTKILQSSGGSHGTVRSNPDGGNGYFTTTGLDKLNVTASYTDFIRVGDGTNRAFDFSPNVVANAHTWDHCTFDGCGDVYYTGTQPATAGLAFTYVKHVNSAGSIPVRLLAAAPSGGAARTISGCSFDKSPSYAETVFAPASSYLGAGYTVNDSGTALDLSGNFLVCPTASGLPVRGNMTDCYVLAHGFDDNPHILNPRSVGSQKTVDGLVVEFTGHVTTDSGNWFYGAGDWIAVRCIVLRCVNEPTEAAGSLTFGSGSTCRMRHCTVYSPDYSGGILLGDLPSGTGMIAEVKSNIFWVDSTDAAGTAAHSIGTTADNAITPAGCVYNGCVNLQATRYQGSYPTTQPGANDIVLTGRAATSIFVLPDRNIATWAVSRGSTAGTYLGKVADGLSYLAADPTLIPALLLHVRAGFAPIETSFRNAGHDGVTIGAVEMGPPITQTHYIFRRDDGTEVTATALAAEDTSVTQPVGVNTRVRIQADAYRDRSPEQMALEYRKTDSLDWRKVQP